MTTILVSGASGIVGYGVLRSLRKANPDYKLIGTTIYDDSVAPAFCDIFELAPKTGDTSYIDWLLKIIEKHHVDMIIPNIEIDMFAWNEAREELAKTGVYVLLNNKDLITLCSDKWKFYERLKQVDSKLAIDTRNEGTFETLQSDFGLPFLLKPRRGYGSKGIVYVKSEKDFNDHREELGEILMAQPIVGTNDQEYSVSAFFDKSSQMLAYMSLRRKLSSEGFTEKAVVAEPKNVKQAITELADLFQPIGPTNFQFRVHDGQLKLLEINPRISSATSIRTAFGYNESAMSVEYFLNNKAPVQPDIKHGSAVRYAEDYIFYDSDSV